MPLRSLSLAQYFSLHESVSLYPIMRYLLGCIGAFIEHAGELCNFSQYYIIYSTIFTVLLKEPHQKMRLMWRPCSREGSYDYDM